MKETSIHLVRRKHDATPFRTEAEVDAVINRLELGRYGDRRQVMKVVEGDLAYLTLTPCPNNSSTFFLKIINGVPHMDGAYQ